MKFTKLFALAVSSVLAVSLLAGCGEKTEGGNENGNEGGNSGNEPSGTLPLPEKQVSSFSDQDVTLTVNGTTNANYDISDSLFGVFLEDINYAGYLLDDNIVPNGSFETFGAKTSGWTEQNAELSVQNLNGVLKNEAEYGARNVNANYGAVNVTAAGGGISSAGHTQLPIAVKKGVDYIFSAFIKSTAAANLTVRIKDSNSTYAEKVLPLKGDGKWVKYRTTLQSSGTATSGVSFELCFDTEGVYNIDGIQLETTEQTGGIKQYAFDAIKELGPKFVRFPGGCIIEGDSAAGGADTTEVYDWKNSVGAVQNGDNAGDDTIPAFTYTLVEDGKETTETTRGEWITRRQNGDLWGYDMEYGVGFLEFFELCENLGASAVPVLNCGMSDLGGAAQGEKGIELNGRHGKKVDDYIQDAIDLIEFAKGDTSTKWGALRAALGHEKPFEMDYLGIGNEQFDAYYTKYYEKFLQSDAFQAAIEQYSVTPIVGNGMFLTNCQNTTKNNSGAVLTEKGTAQRAAEDAVRNHVIDKVSDYGVHDQHYYVNWTTLLENYAMYDGYKKTVLDPDTAYHVFVGEYSANTDLSGFSYYRNELIAALSEAAMMTSYERNGNVIDLAAYAPMFGVANKSASAAYGGDDAVNQWDVDMMYFTNTEIVRTANYYVQQMFMQNQGATYLYRSKLNWTSEETFSFPATSGAAKTFNKLYYVPTMADNGDILLKVVNVSGEGVKMNIEISNADSSGFAYVTELTANDYKAVNTLKSEAVKPAASSVGWSGQNFGYEFKPYSFTILRIPTKA